MRNQDWDIKPRGPNCAKCNVDFADGEPYISELGFGEAGYVRADFCRDCWNIRPLNGAAVSVWKGVFKLPPPPEPEPLKKETAESLLRQLIETGDETKANVIFILAVMLERRRILIEREVKESSDGSRLRLYEHRASGDSFIIKDPLLKLEQVQEVQIEVMRMLNPPGSEASGED